MARHNTHLVPRLLLAAGLSLGAAWAHAGGGCIVAADQESIIKPGMNAAQVEKAIGAPAKTLQFRNEAGPTWSYAVSGSQLSVFEVSFGADGTVVASGERLDTAGRAHGDRR
jgi:hypothetical protein